MSNTLTISYETIIAHFKLSFQLSTIIEDAIARSIITEKAKEYELQIEPEELQQAADSFRLENQLENVTETLEWLQKHYMSLEDFEEAIHFNLIKQKLAQKLFAEKVEAFFLENQVEYTGAVIYEVIMNDLNLALEIYYALREGEIAFHEVARTYIQEANLRRAGGYRGIVLRSKLKPEISAAVFAANPPQILKPIITATGVHLIQVEELIEPELGDSLKNKILTDLFTLWLKKQVIQTQVNLSLA
jgi:parvulin-like peptidyl-prolyl isomerase